MTRKSLLPPAKGHRKMSVVILNAVLFRKRGESNWKASIRIGGKRPKFFDTATPLEEAAQEFTILKIRELTRLSEEAQSTPEDKSVQTTLL